MIIKKPYAFLIKHFRIIHLMLTILILFIMFKTNSIVKFFNDYVKNGYYTYYNNMSSKFINFYMFIAIILIILLAAFIYLLMRWKKKSRLFYVSLCIFYFLLFIGFLVYFNLFVTILNKSLSIKAIRAYRDVSILMYLPQYIFLVIAIIRAIGFDIKKFDFKKDLEELDIAEEDQEEIEVTFGQNTYKYKRKARRIWREIKFYAIENKFFFAAICGVFTLVLAFVIYINVSFNKSYKESQFFTIDGVIFKVMESYVTDVGYNGSVINKDNKYFVIKVSMENTNQTRVNLSTESLRLVLDDEYYFPNYTKSDYFRDLGEGYYKNTLYPAEKYEFLIVYEVPLNKEYDDIYFRMIDNVSLIKGEITSSHKDVKLRPINIMKNNSREEYNVGDAISLENSTLYNSELVVKSSDIRDVFEESYTYCIKECYTGRKIIQADTLGRNDRTILRLDIELDLDEDLYVNKFLTSNTNFISMFGSVSYILEGKEKTASITIKTLENIETDKVYIEVPTEIRRAISKKLKINIRNREYVINL